MFFFACKISTNYLLGAGGPGLTTYRERETRFGFEPRLEEDPFVCWICSDPLSACDIGVLWICEIRRIALKACFEYHGRVDTL